jgi:hypothetical protein
MSDLVFENWVKKIGWLYIHPLKVYQHPTKEVFKTLEELQEIFNNKTIKPCTHKP